MCDSLTGTTAEPVELAALADAPTNEQQKPHREATEKFENNKKKCRDDTNSVWCMLALTFGSKSLTLIRHDCVGKDGLGDGPRAWNLLKEKLKNEESPTVAARISQIARMQLEPDEALHE